MVMNIFIFQKMVGETWDQETIETKTQRQS